MGHIRHMVYVVTATGEYLGEQRAGAVGAPEDDLRFPRPGKGLYRAKPHARRRQSYAVEARDILEAAELAQASHRGWPAELSEVVPPTRHRAR